MRLLAYWIVFMVLLVVFVPAFSMIFSPPAYMPTSESSECPPCPECPPCECPPVVAFHLSRFYPADAFIYEYKDFVNAYLGYGIYYPEPQRGHKYFLLANISSSIGFFVDHCGYVEELDDWVCYEIVFRRLNATHVYAFTKYPLRYLGFHIGIFHTENPNRVRNIYIDVYLVKEATTLQEILQYLR